MSRKSVEQEVDMDFLEDFLDDPLAGKKASPPPPPAELKVVREEVVVEATPEPQVVATPKPEPVPVVASMPKQSVDARTQFPRFPDAERNKKRVSTFLSKSQHRLVRDLLDELQEDYKSCREQHVMQMIMHFVEQDLNQDGKLWNKIKKEYFAAVKRAS